MTNERRLKLYDNLCNHISELANGKDLVYTLHAIGFTYEEILEEFPLDVNRSDIEEINNGQE